MRRFSGLVGLPAAAVVALMLITGAQSAAAACANRGLGDVARVSEREIATLCETNEFRARQGMKPLHLDARLSAAARAHARDMHDRGYFDHVAPGGRTFVDRIGASGYGSYRAASENIAMGYSTPSEVVQGWIDSPGHRANMLGGPYRDIGIGIHGEYYVQLFAGPGHSPTGITGLEPEYQVNSGPRSVGPAVTGFVIQRFGTRSYRMSAGNAVGQRLRVVISRERVVCPARRARRKARCVKRWKNLNSYAIPVIDGAPVPIRARAGLALRIRFVLPAFTSGGINYPGYSASVTEGSR